MFRKYYMPCGLSVPVFFFSYPVENAQAKTQNSSSISAILSKSLFFHSRYFVESLKWLSSNPGKRN